MKKILFSLLTLITSLIQAQNYQLVWFDEFSNATIDAANWTHETGGNGWGNNELQYYTNRDVNSYILGGSLVIEAKKESYGGKNYTSARMITKGKRYFTYGKIEARIDFHMDREFGRLFGCSEKIFQRWDGLNAVK